MASLIFARLGNDGLREINRDAKPEYRGAVAQLGERLLCKQEVRGSNPLSSIFSGSGIYVQCGGKQGTFPVGEV